MFTINEIKGEGNTYQQDRTGKIVQSLSDGTEVVLMWAIDGHGKKVGFNQHDTGGMVSRVIHKFLTELSGEQIKNLYDNTEYGISLYAEIQSKIELAKDQFMISLGWKKLVDVDGNDINVLWTKTTGRIITSSGGAMLILVACVKTDAAWKGRMYNVGDSMMIHNDTVYSQSGIDGLSDKAVLSLTQSKIKTIYSAVPGSFASKKNYFHRVSPIDAVVTINPTPSIVRGRHQYYVSNVRSDTALSICLTYTPDMFTLKPAAVRALRSFAPKTELASWSNMGDSQNAWWASEPSYSKQFVITGPLSLISDGIGDILKSEGDTSLDEKTDWFNYSENHPMHTANPNKNCIFKNGWFHETVMGIDEDSKETVHDDPFYEVAKATFGVADNICRVTFMP